MKFGIEVEAIGGRSMGLGSTLRRLGSHDTNIDYDGSLPDSGRELKPHGPLAPNRVEPWIKGTLNALKEHNFRITQACGLHIHMDRSSVPYAVAKKLAIALGAWAWAVRENYPTMDARLFGTTRRRLGGQYAHAPSLECIHIAVTRGPERSSFTSHYSAVSWSDHYPTIEVRMPCGTLCTKRLTRVWHHLRLALYAVRTGVVDGEYDLLERSMTVPDGVRVFGIPTNAGPAAAALGLALQEAVIKLQERFPLPYTKRGKALKKTHNGRRIVVVPADAIVLARRDYEIASPMAMCRNRANNRGFICTRSIGHEGEHGATDVAQDYEFDRAPYSDSYYWAQEAPETEGVLSA